MPYVYSTLSANVEYAVYEESKHKEISVIHRTILIKGGANIIHISHPHTPVGIQTEVSDEDLELLEKDYHFKEHVKHGFIKVSHADKAVEKAVKDMKAKDASAPLTPDDEIFKKKDENGNTKGVTVSESTKSYGKKKQNG
jgi:hypothetical protein